MTGAAVKSQPAIRAVRVELLGLQRHRLAVATIVADADLPEIIMFNGDPFLRDHNIVGIAYRQVHPYRLDAGE